MTTEEQVRLKAIKTAFAYRDAQYLYSLRLIDNMQLIRAKRELDSAMAALGVMRPALSERDEARVRAGLLSGDELFNLVNRA